MVEDREYIILKAIEELSELQEVLIKFITKPIGAFEGDRRQHLVEELGDVELRLTLLQKELGIMDEVELRVISKGKTLGIFQE